MIRSLHEWISTHNYKAPQELPYPFHHIRTQNKALYEPGTGLSPNTKSTGILMLYFSAFRTVGTQFFVKAPTLWYSVMVAGNTVIHKKYIFGLNDQNIFLTYLVYVHSSYLRVPNSWNFLSNKGNRNLSCHIWSPVLSS